MMPRFWLVGLVMIATLGSLDAQATTRRESPRQSRDKILIRIDSLRDEFDHAPLTAEESERLREEMKDAMSSIEPVFAYNFQMEQVTQGYIGVTFDGPSIELPRRQERVIRFLDYPRVSMVEPGSPAERGGILQGDTLLSLNGSDVKDREISLTRLLIPDRRIMLRVRRAGRPRDLRVTVDTSPEYIARRMVPMAPMAPMVVAVPTPPATSYAPEMPVRAMAAPRAPRSAMPMIAMTDGAMWIEADGVAGARLETVTEGLGKALGVQSGVLVMRASPGTPAYESGLREGDVILRADDKDMTSVRALRRAVAVGDGMDGVRLVVLRERKERTITLRW
jgi:C-terminal processing protease CtpA/Prc